MTFRVKDLLLSGAIMQRDGMEQTRVAISSYAKMNNNEFLHTACQYELVVAKLDEIITELKQTE